MWIRKKKLEEMIQDICLKTVSRISHTPIDKYPAPIDVRDEYMNIIIDDLTYIELVNYVIRGKDIIRNRPKVIIKGGDENRSDNESPERAL